MTTLATQRHTCAVCGTPAEYTIVASTSEIGSSDLDTRPPEMIRSTMDYWMQECRACGYCAPTVERGPDGADDVVRSEAYARQRKNAAFPDLANRFLCRAMLLSAAGNHRDAFWEALHAAWACDDAGASNAAAICRSRAVEAFEMARGTQPIVEEPGLAEAILADVLRRSRQFAAVERVCRAGLSKAATVLVVRALEFQKLLAERGDVDAHTMKEAVTPLS